MTTITEYFKQAELALATYSNLATGVPDVGALNDGGNGLAIPQADQFSKNWRVVTQYNHTEQLPTYDDAGNLTGYVTSSNGLSVTVFEEVASGKRYLAIRGTQDANDLITDLVSVAVLGTPLFQSQYQSLRAKVQEWLTDGTLPQTFTVSGHSLGGFLATGLAAEFSANVEHTYLYNSPGLNGVLGGATAVILQALGITVSFPLFSVFQGAAC